MSKITNLMAFGVPDKTATEIATDTVYSAPTRSASGTLTATGSTIADALALVAFINVVGTTASGTGVGLPSTWPVGQIGFVQNNGANALTIYPHSASGTINGGSAGAGVTTAAAAGALVTRQTSTNWLVYVLAKES